MYINKKVKLIAKRKQPFASKDDLYNDYVIIGMSTRDIAKKYNVAQSTVRRLMQKYDIHYKIWSDLVRNYKLKYGRRVANVCEHKCHCNFIKYNGRM